MLIDFRQVTNLNTLGRYATQLKVIFLLHVCPVISQLMSSRPTSLERNFPLALTNTCILLMVHTPRIRTLTVQRLKFSVIGLLRILTPMLSQCFHCPVISHAHNRQAFIPFLVPPSALPASHTSQKVTSAYLPSNFRPRTASRDRKFQPFTPSPSDPTIPTTTRTPSTYPNLITNHDTCAVCSGL
jgi:hypothetical protein